MIHIEIRGLEAATRLVKKHAEGIEKAMRQAVNRAGDSAKAAAIKGIRAEANLKTDKIKKIVAGIKPYPGAVVVYRVRSPRKRLGLMAYGAKQFKKGVKVKIRKSSGAIMIPHAFIAPVKFTAAGGLTDSAKQVFRRTTKKRFPIQKLLGPTAGQLLEAQKENIFDRFAERFPIEFDRSLKRLIK